MARGNPISNAVRNGPPTAPRDPKRQKNVKKDLRDPEV